MLCPASLVLAEHAESQLAYYAEQLEEQLEAQLRAQT